MSAFSQSISALTSFRLSQQIMLEILKWSGCYYQFYQPVFHLCLVEFTLHLQSAHPQDEIVQSFILTLPTLRQMQAVDLGLHLGFEDLPQLVWFAFVLL